MSNTSMVHTSRALIKVIEDPGCVRLKICPRYDVDGSAPDFVLGKAPVPEYDEMDAAVGTEMSWEECNILIRHIRTHRDRVFGTAE